MLRLEAEAAASAAAAERLFSDDPTTRAPTTTSTTTTTTTTNEDTTTTYSTTASTTTGNGFLNKSKIFLRKTVKNILKIPQHRQHFPLRIPLLHRQQPKKHFNLQIRCQPRNHSPPNRV